MFNTAITVQRPENDGNERDVGESLPLHPYPAEASAAQDAIVGFATFEEADWTM